MVLYGGSAMPLGHVTRLAAGAERAVTEGSGAQEAIRVRVEEPSGTTGPAGQSRVRHAVLLVLERGQWTCIRR